MGRLTAVRALELTLKQWMLMLEGWEKWLAARKASPLMRLHYNSHSCFLCEFSKRLGDDAAWDSSREQHTCPHCPCYIISGHCMAPESPCRAWSTNSENPELIEMVISQILGIQAEWESTGPCSKSI